MRSPVFTIPRQHAAVPRLSRTTSMEETQPTGSAKLAGLLDRGLIPDDEFRKLKPEIRLLVRLVYASE